MFKWATRAAAAAFGIALGLDPTAGRSQETEITFAIPALTLTFTAHFVAEDAGYFKAEGLKVTTRNLTGVASPNAVNTSRPCCLRSWFAAIRTSSSAFSDA